MLKFIIIRCRKVGITLLKIYMATLLSEIFTFKWLQWMVSHARLSFIPFSKLCFYMNGC